MTGLLPAWVYEFHPDDTLFVVPVVTTVLAYFGLPRLFPPAVTFLLVTGSAAVLSVLLIMIFIIGRPWPLIGVTAALIAALYLPLCFVVWILCRWAAPTAAPQRNS